jgi:serine phosphatase RsbU (regulator of sigma subunit)
VRTIDGIAAGNYGTPAGRYAAVELARLAESVDAMSRALADAEGRRKAATDKARRIQHHLLPERGGLPGLDVGVFYRSADEVAGDYYDLLPMPDGTTVVCVADVVGHGVPAAMIAAMLKVLIAEAAAAHDDPGDMLGWVNRRLTAVTLPEDFATVFLARWNPAAGRLRYASAGHEPALFVPADGPAVALESTGTLLGIDGGSTWETGELSVQGNDLLACWTDGLSEAWDAAGRMFGRERVTALVEENRTATPAVISERVQTAVLGHVGKGTVTDDCTLLVVRFEGRGVCGGGAAGQ